MSNNVKLKSQLYKYMCGNCSNQFKSPMYPVGDSSYGEFLLKSRKCNDMVYLYALGDPVFSELSRMVRNDSRVSKMNDLSRSNIFQKIIGVAYDKDSRGYYFCVGFPPVCPICGDDNFKKYEETNPPEYKIIDVPRATSIEWNGLGQEQKINLVAASLSEQIQLS